MTTDLSVAAAPKAPTASAKLDFLRVIAVFAVVLSHVYFEVFTLAAVGRVGVILFFVHTSLVLMFSLERQARIDGQRRRFTTFLLRRVFRIYPLSIVTVIAVLAFQIPASVYGDGTVHFTGTDKIGLITNLLLVQNVVVSDGGDQLLGVLWTLPIEVQMYLFLPFLFATVLPRIKDSRYLILAWFGSALIALVTPPIMSKLFGPSLLSLDWGWIVFPRLLEFAPAFLAGVLAYGFWQHSNRSLPFVLLPVLLLSLLALYAATISLPVSGRFSVAVWMVSCLGLGLLLPRIAEPVHPLITRTSATIAKYSYGIYLVHVPCIWFGFDVLNEHSPLLQWAVFLFCTSLISILLHHVVEKPFITLGAHLGRRWAEAGELTARVRRNRFA